MGLLSLFLIRTSTRLAIISRYWNLVVFDPFFTSAKTHFCNFDDLDLGELEELGGPIARLSSGDHTGDMGIIWCVSCKNTGLSIWSGKPRWVNSHTYSSYHTSRF